MDITENNLDNYVNEITTFDETISENGMVISFADSSAVAFKGFDVFSPNVMLSGSTEISLR